MKRERYFYDWEQDKVLGMDDMSAAYREFGDYGESFEHFIENCLTRNNGCLDEITNNKIEYYLQKRKNCKNRCRFYGIKTKQELAHVPANALACFEIDYAEADENGDDVDNIIVYIP